MTRHEIRRAALARAVSADPTASAVYQLFHAYEHAAPRQRTQHAYVGGLHALARTARRHPRADADRRIARHNERILADDPRSPRRSGGAVKRWHAPTNPEVRAALYELGTTDRRGGVLTKRSRLARLRDARALAWLRRRAADAPPVSSRALQAWLRSTHQEARDVLLRLYRRKRVQPCGVAEGPGFAYLWRAT